MVATKPDFTCVPTVAIDIMWHELMRHPIDYADVCHRLFQKNTLLNHNDQLPRRALNENFEKTARLWGAMYGENYGNTAYAFSQVQQEGDQTGRGDGTVSYGSCGTAVNFGDHSGDSGSVSGGDLGGDSGGDFGSSCGGCGGGGD